MDSLFRAVAIIIAAICLLPFFCIIFAFAASAGPIFGALLIICLITGTFTT